MLRVALVAGCMAAALFCVEAAAQPAQPNTPPFPAWDNFVDGLRKLGPEMMAKLPERLRNDPQVQQEIGRLMLEAIASSTIDAISRDGDHPVFLPASNITLNIGQPNADTTYKSATIAPGGIYRLRGLRGTLRIFKVGQFGNLPGQSHPGSIVPLAYDDFNKLRVDTEGRYDVILSAARPAGYAGDWWQLDPKTNSLLLRQVGFDWRHDRDPTISIERLDVPVRRPRPSAADLEQRLNGLSVRIENIASMFVDHVEGLRREGYINRLKVFDVSHLGGLVGQFYYEGAYDLSPDEALIVEAKVPAGCTYWSIILTNDIYETTDWYNNQSSLNGAQARVDRDGIFRAVVSEKDPGVPNWLDTAGYPTGAIQGRWTDCQATPIPTVRKVALADVRKSLPADTPTVTPAEREQAVRERRAQVQQRPLW
jgi:hypothetical protein